MTGDRRDRPADAVVLADTVDRLRSEIDGLRTAMRRRAVIEQAKGVLMARLGCSADDAFARLSAMSQDTNRKLVDVAAELLGTAVPSPEPAPTAPGAPETPGAPEAAVEPGPGPLGGGESPWALLDSLLNPAVILRPVRDDTGAVVDFRVAYANAATVDLAGRTGEQLLGGRMTELYPGMVVSGIFRELLRVQASGIPYQGTAQQFIEVVGGVLHSSTMIMRATVLPGGLLLNWRIEDEDERRGAQLAQAQRLAHIGIWDYDVGSGELSWSSEVFGILGRDEADGVPDLDTAAGLVDPADLPAARAMAQALVDERRTQTLEFRVVRPDGRTCTVRAAAEPVSTPDGSGLVAVRGVLQDVSAWRRDQAALDEARGQLTEERERTAVEHRAVRMLQRALLTVPDTSDPRAVRFAARYVPAAEGAQVGGDWYDAATLPDGRTLVAIGDVSGHGLPAAAAMTQLRHALRGMAYTGAEPATILRRLNEMVCSQRSDYIATAICAHVDPKTTELTWAQAGHPPPVHMRAGVPRVLEPPRGMVLGATLEADYGTGSVALAPGDMLLMYTDGLVARRGDDLGRGLSRLVRSLREDPSDDLQACITRIMRDLGAPNPRDDTCLIGIRVPEVARSDA
ncbi:SpoIIE family protein phosphatase [Uniformispora flossi]|uniref:SpoIIE family protein phosphatase n=1 Tax=Uniformispora flossi TaxID=3390723 RepID=UPI003C2FAA6D